MLVGGADDAWLVEVALEKGTPEEVGSYQMVDRHDEVVRCQVPQVLRNGHIHVRAACDCPSTCLGDGVLGIPEIKKKELQDL